MTKRSSHSTTGAATKSSAHGSKRLTGEVTKGARSKVVGSKAFSAITAVEGLRLSGASKKRLADLRRSAMSPDQRRAEVVRAYAPGKTSK